MYQGCIPKKTKNRRPIDEIAPKKQKMYMVPKIRICRYLCTRATSPPQKITEGLLMKLLKKNKIKNNLNTCLLYTSDAADE